MINVAISAPLGFNTLLSHETLTLCMNALWISKIKKIYIFITQRGYVRHKDIAVSNHDQFCDAEAITLCFFKFVQAQNTPIDSCIDWLRKYQTNRNDKCDVMLPW